MYIKYTKEKYIFDVFNNNFINQIMDKHIIGENAGILWRLLSTDAQIIIESTGISKDELAIL